MLRPPTETPSRDARPPRRPGAVVLPVAALATIVALSVALTAHGGAAGNGPHGASLPAHDTAGTGSPADPVAPSAGSTGGHPSAQAESPTPLPIRTTGRTAGGRTEAKGTQAATAGATTGSTAVPSPSGTTAEPSPRQRATPRPHARTPYDTLRVGDCFDIARDAPGTVVPRGCDTPHDAEVVARPLLTGDYADDRAVRDTAAALCRPLLRAKAADQPLGTRWTTFVQYPYRTSYLLGEDRIACSLATPSGTGRKLTTHLQ
ncbi:hypothetical protein ACFYU9_03570 [Streptomyces sp. NPDC004327]|uniref:hypothetical protein n=1 Tax=unclassified Streptomyces TaxID=2593676 RepID=UPI00367A5901